MIEIEKKIDLIKALIQIKSEVRLFQTCYNYGKDGSAAFSGYSDISENTELITIVIDRNQVQFISKCGSILEINEYFNQMKYLIE